jgi:hypothetical protein
MLTYSRSLLGRVVEEGSSRRMGAAHDRHNPVSIHCPNEGMGTHYFLLASCL